MRKPSPEARVAILDYHECVKYVEERLGYDIRDTLGKYATIESGDAEYRDWWHFICDHRSISNPCEITIGSDLLEGGGSWRDEITSVFIDEFGDNAEYLVYW